MAIDRDAELSQFDHDASALLNALANLNERMASDTVILGANVGYCDICDREEICFIIHREHEDRMRLSISYVCPVHLELLYKWEEDTTASIYK
jgi:transcription elongation GreA/GreB family factor